MGKPSRQSFPTHSLYSLEQVSDQHHSFAARTIVDVYTSTGPILFLSIPTTSLTRLDYPSTTGTPTNQQSKCNSRTLSLAQPCCLPLLKPPWPLVPLPSSTTAVSPSTIRLSEVAPTQPWPNSRAATPRDTATRALASRSSSLPMPLPLDPCPSSSSPGPTARSRTISQTSMATPSQLAVWRLSHPCRTTPTTRPACLLTALLAKLPAPLPTTPPTTPAPWSAIRTPTSS